MAWNSFGAARVDFSAHPGADLGAVGSMTFRLSGLARIRP